MKTLVVDGVNVLLDDWDWLRLCRYKWRVKTVSDNGKRKYIVRDCRKNGKRLTIYIHRAVMNCPEGMEVHHKEGNFWDNRKEMLEVVTSIVHTNIHKKNFVDKNETS